MHLPRRCRAATFIFTIAFAAVSHLAGQARPRAAVRVEPFAQSPEYQSPAASRQRLKTWDVSSVTTHVLLPEGLAIHFGIKHNSTVNGDMLLTDTLLGASRRTRSRFPGPHAWDGSYTDLRLVWKGHSWRVQSAHAGDDLVVLATLLPSETKEPLSPTIVFTVDFLWNKPGTVTKLPGEIERSRPHRARLLHLRRCEARLIAVSAINISPLTGKYFAADFVGPVAVTTGKRRTLSEAQAAVDEARVAYEASVAKNKATGPIVDAIETTLGWDTIFEPEKGRVVSPVSRVWSVGWGGYVIFDWDTFFAATLAAVGDKDLAYANAIEILREETAEGFVPNYARAGDWKSFDRSEPPVGAITVLGLYQQFGDRWFLNQTFPALLKWNDWWAEHRDVDGYLCWGSDGQNRPANLDDSSGGTRQGAILESGLDNSPMYDDAAFDGRRHVDAVSRRRIDESLCRRLRCLGRDREGVGPTPGMRKFSHARATVFRNSLKTLWDPATEHLS